MNRGPSSPQVLVADELVADIYRQLGYSSMQPALLTAAEVSQVLRVKEATLRNWRTTQRPALPYTRIGHSPMYRPRDVAAFILFSTEGATQ